MRTPQRPGPADAAPPPLPDEAALSAAERAADTAALVDRARGGDRRAFDALVRRYRPRIHALALHLTGDPNDADDVTQEAFLRAYDRLPGFGGRSALFTWLYRIAVRGALNHRRAARRRRTWGLDDPRIAPALAVDAAADPRARAELRERYGLLLRAFDELGEALRVTVVLVTLQGLSHGEAAVVLGTREGTVSWRLHEARRRLRARVTALEALPRAERARVPAGRLGEALDLAVRALGAAAPEAG